MMRQKDDLCQNVQYTHLE